MTFVKNGLFVENPVIRTIIFQLQLAEESFEKIAHVLIIRLLIEIEVPHVVHILLELDGAALAENVNRCIIFLHKHLVGPPFRFFIFK